MCLSSYGVRPTRGDTHHVGGVCAYFEPQCDTHHVGRIGGLVSVALACVLALAARLWWLHIVQFNRRIARGSDELSVRFEQFTRRFGAAFLLAAALYLAVLGIRALIIN